MKKVFMADTYEGRNERWPGSADNPMRPIYAKNPQTGEEHLCHYNANNLSSNRDYEDSGFIWIKGRGWCYPIDVEVEEGKTILNGIALGWPV